MPPVILSPRPAVVTTPTPSTGNASVGGPAPAINAPAAPATPAPTGLDAATTAGTVPAGNVPSGNGGATAGTPLGVGGLNLRNFSNPVGAGALDLIPGRVPDAVSLPLVLKQMAGSPAGEQTVRGLAAQLEAQAGIKVPEAMIAAVLAKPERVTELLVLTPTQMQQGLQGLNAAHRAGQVPATAPRAYQLPSVVDMLTPEKYPVKRPAGDLKELAPGLLRGEVPSDLSDARAAQNIRMAEVLDRLSNNAGAPANERFTAKLGNREFTRVDTFLKALTQMGYQVDAVLTHRVADFAGLKTRAPDGSLLDVPASMLVRTGVKDAQGREAVVPTVHSEIVYRVRAGTDPAPSVPGLDADVKWYQGVPHTGFFPADLMRKSTWTGTVQTEHWEGAKALQAAQLSSLLSDVIRDSASAAGLLMSGYGITGVCNDSVAVVQQAVAGRSTAYPLLMQDATLSGEIQKRLTDKDKRDDPAYRTLSKAMADTPSDATANSSSRARALASIPWAAGAEPFGSTEQARATLSAN
jgi:hypothetical protein